MTIREYQTTDLAAIVDIYALSKLDELRFESTLFKLLPLPEDEKRYRLFNESDVYIYDDQGAVGYVAIFGSEIRSLYVHPKSRGQGIGKCLLEFALSIIEQDVYLYVVKSNQLAKNLYILYGFEVVDELEATYNGQSVWADKMQRPHSKNS